VFRKKTFFPLQSLLMRKDKNSSMRRIKKVPKNGTFFFFDFSNIDFLDY